MSKTTAIIRKTAVFVAVRKTINAMNGSDAVQLQTAVKMYRRFGTTFVMNESEIEYYIRALIEDGHLELSRNEQGKDMLSLTSFGILYYSGEVSVSYGI